MEFYQFFRYFYVIFTTFLKNATFQQILQRETFFMLRRKILQIFIKNG